ncbi:MAG: nucleotidyltransferase domain-containing protein [Chitinophagaceae bacterium]|nr:MAG: nucleotidyltransferase domain-containing protein [Chitinophagaceae bacterium]
MNLRQDIIAALAYFDLFDYPLTQTEIVQFVPAAHAASAVAMELRTLLSEKLVYHYDGLFLLRNEPALVSRRRSGNQRARLLLQKADKVARLLAAFPFVRGVAVSGSLSKNYADESSDIDLFIITAPNRLWIARTILHGLKKLSFLVGREQYFCMNYFIDEAGLEIREKNIYTATEVATLLPLQGIAAFDAFFRANNWSHEFLPNHLLRVSYVQDRKLGWMKRSLEWCLTHGAGNFFDSLLMRITARRWKRKTDAGRRNNRGIVLSMEAGKHFAKPDPRRFQAQLLARYDNHICQLQPPLLKTYSPARS